MIRDLFQKIKNFFYWGWKLRNDYNYDYCSIYFILELKLINLRNVCYYKGHHVWSEKSREYKAISECIEICKKLQKEESPYYDRFKAEFGPGQDYEFKELENGYSELINNNTEIYQKQLRIAFEKDEKLKKMRKARLFELMNKWSGAWWD